MRQNTKFSAAFRTFGTKQFVRKCDNFQVLNFSYNVSVTFKETGAHGPFQNSRKPKIKSKIWFSKSVRRLVAKKFNEKIACVVISHGNWYRLVKYIFPVGVQHCKLNQVFLLSLASLCHDLDNFCLHASSVLPRRSQSHPFRSSRPALLRSLNKLQQ